MSKNADDLPMNLIIPESLLFSIFIGAFSDAFCWWLLSMVFTDALYP
jgi:hypothetical protein